MAIAKGAPEPPERVIGRYRLRQRIGGGGMGAVYLADVVGPGGFGKWFAVKLLHAHYEESERVIRMFHEEARIASRIEHPNVCQVIDFGRDESGTLYFVMEYLRGEPLSFVLEHGGLLPDWVSARVIADAARGLHAAHEARDEAGRLLGIVHRDVSPQNLFVLYAGPTKVLDFGIARVRGGLQVTRENELRGKLGYMSPEQIEDRKNVDQRTDVWALGVVLWEALAGQRLFRGESESDTLMRVLHGRIARPGSLRPVGDAKLDDVVMRALQRDRGQRYESAAALADALEDWLHRRPERTGHAEVARWMTESFRKAIEASDRSIAILAADEITGLSGVVASTTTALPMENETSLEQETEPRPPPAAPTVTAPLLDVPTRVHQPRRGETPTPLITRTADVPVRARHQTLFTVGFAVVLAAVCATVLAVVLSGTDEPQVQALPAMVRLPPLPAQAAPPMPMPAAVGSGVAQDQQPTTTTTTTTTAVVVEPVVVDEEGGTQGPVVVRNGRLNLMAIPEADVFLGRRRLGRTPLVGFSLPAGTHRLDLRYVDGRAPPRSVTARIRSGETTRIAVR